MKVVCNKDFSKDPLNGDLTYGRVYEVQPVPHWGNEDSHFVISDKGYLSCYLKTCFLTVEEWREKQLKQIL